MKIYIVNLAMKIIFKETIIFISKMGSKSSNSNEIIYQPPNEKNWNVLFIKMKVWMNIFTN